MEYQTQSDETVPTAVAMTFDDPTEWDRIDPQNIRVLSDYDARLYEGQVNGERQYVTDNGYASRANRHDYVVQLSDDHLPAVGEGPVTYLDGIDVVHHDHYAEHVTKVIVVVGPNERAVLNSRSGVLWWGYDQADMDDETMHMALSLADSGPPLSINDQDSPTFEQIDGYETALDGWHSSMEQSAQSDMMNALAKGDLPPEAHDSADPYPYFVRYGDTRNVCAVNASVYGKPELSNLLREYFADERAAPAYSGF